MNGYMGKILVVDLAKKELKDEPLNEQYARDFIGAGGIACRYLADGNRRAQLQPLGGHRTLPIYNFLRGL
jgi:aldehyde:ferredoxin oxidoreductase